MLNGIDDAKKNDGFSQLLSRLAREKKKALVILRGDHQTNSGLIVEGDSFGFFGIVQPISHVNEQTGARTDSVATAIFFVSDVLTVTEIPPEIQGLPCRGDRAVGLSAEDLAALGIGPPLP